LCDFAAIFVVEEVLLSQQSVFSLYIRRYRDGVDSSNSLEKRMQLRFCPNLFSLCQSAKKYLPSPGTPFYYTASTVRDRQKINIHAPVLPVFPHELSDPAKDLVQP
jgi:hypothetical protein